MRWLLQTGVLLLLLASAGCAVRSTTGAYLQDEPGPATEAERSERCTSYARRMERSRTAMQRRNTFGRLDLLRAEHRRMERFVDNHCN